MEAREEPQQKVARRGDHAAIGAPGLAGGKGGRAWVADSSSNTPRSPSPRRSPRKGRGKVKAPTPTRKDKGKARAPTPHDEDADETPAESARSPSPRRAPRQQKGKGTARAPTLQDEDTAGAPAESARSPSPRRATRQEKGKGKARAPTPRDEDADETPAESARSPSPRRAPRKGRGKGKAPAPTRKGKGTARAPTPPDEDADETPAESARSPSPRRAPRKGRGKGKAPAPTRKGKGTARAPTLQDEDTDGAPVESARSPSPRRSPRKGRGKVKAPTPTRKDKGKARAPTPHDEDADETPAESARSPSPRRAPRQQKGKGTARAPTLQDEDTDGAPAESARSPSPRRATRQEKGKGKARAPTPRDEDTDGTPAEAGIPRRLNPEDYLKDGSEIPQFDDSHLFAFDEPKDDPSLPGPSDRRYRKKTLINQAGATPYSAGRLPDAARRRVESAGLHFLNVITEVARETNKSPDAIFRSTGWMHPEAAHPRQWQRANIFKRWWASTNTPDPTESPEQRQARMNAAYRAKMDELGDEADPEAIARHFKEQYDFCADLAHVAEKKMSTRQRQKEIDSLGEQFSKLALGAHMSNNVGVVGYVVDLHGWATSAMFGGGPTYQELLRRYSGNFSESLHQVTTILRLSAGV
ncbi:hypothetical protein HDZ31DRAFT_67338 [Schizophyllum fasciatum]